jgi:hypothetical protein
MDIPAEPFQPATDAPRDNLLDLPEELAVRVLRAIPDAAALCRMSRTCKLLAAMASLDDLWRERLRGDLGIIDSVHPAAPGAARFRSFFTLEDACWRRLRMASRDDSHHMLNPKPGRPGRNRRTGAATCQLGSATLIFGGTLGGNFGPFLDDIFSITLDAARECVQVHCISLGYGNEEESVRLEMGEGPGPRRGHTMTAVALRQGPAAVVMGGWGSLTLDMHPHILIPTRTAKRGFIWSKPEISGAPPAGRAFHSATALGGGIVLVYGGLGEGCCRSDFAVLDLEMGTWSAPIISGSPQCGPGRAGHGAVFVPQASPPASGAQAQAGATQGRLFLVAGASRSIFGDAHQKTVSTLSGSLLRLSLFRSFLSSLMTIAVFLSVIGGRCRREIPSRPVPSSRRTELEPRPTVCAP